MAEHYGSEINVGPPPATLQKRRSFGFLKVLLLLLILGAGGGLVWLNLEAVTEMLHSATGINTGAPAASGSDVLASVPEPAVSPADFTAFQQQTTGSIQTATDLLTAQQNELRRLSDQLQGLTAQVAALAAKIDQMPQRPAAATPQAAAPAAPVAAAPAPRPAPTAARKRAPAERPAGAISVGGAPLSSTPAR